MEALIHKGSAHYNIYRCPEGIELLREIFPDAKADEMNFCLFSTSGVHGSYATIEDAEKDFDSGDVEEKIDRVTFLVVHPRLVCLRYGNAHIATLADIRFLKKLRESSLEVVSTIGLQ